jgi:hypothetical protein
VVWILQKLYLHVVSSLGQASSLCALVNNINFIGGAGSGAVVLILPKLYLHVVSRLGRSSSLCALGNNINFIGGAGSGSQGMDLTGLWIRKDLFWIGLWVRIRLLKKFWLRLWIRILFWIRQRWSPPQKSSTANSHCIREITTIYKVFKKMN